MGGERGELDCVSGGPAREWNSIYTNGGLVSMQVELGVHACMPPTHMA